MKCRSRSTFGVIIGSLSALVYIGAISGLIVGLFIVNGEYGHAPQRINDIPRVSNTIITFMVLCAIMLFLSGLFIAGIVKRRHKMMIPWLLINVIGLVALCERFLFSFIGLIIEGCSVISVLGALVVGSLGIGTSGFILWSIYILYCDIRKKKNISKNGAVAFVAKQIEYQVFKNKNGSNI